MSTDPKTTTEAPKKTKAPTTILKAGATIRDSDGRPRKLADSLPVEFEERDGRCVVTRPIELAGHWFDVREV